MEITQNINMITPTQEELCLLNRLGEEYKNFSEMSSQDRAFLTSLLIRKKPKKILEVGVAKGGSSFIILNTIKEFSHAHLYSCDYNEDCYSVPGKKTGFYVDEFPELKSKWTLFTGGLTLNFLDEIGADIDFCLIDTAHVNPGEILDFLMVLPYLNKEATVVFHDTNLHLGYMLVGYEGKQYTTSLLMSAVSGQKLIPSQAPYKSALGKYNYFNNIGAVELYGNEYKNVYEIFNLLTIQWEYMPTDVDLAQLTAFLKRFYGEYYVEYFNEIIKWQKDVFEDKSKKKALKVNCHFLKQIFSITNEKQITKDYFYKVICIFGLKMRIKINKRNHIN